MPFNRPTLQELIDRNRASVEANLEGVDARVRWSTIGALVATKAGAHHEMFGYLAWIAQQIFPDTVESGQLERMAQPFAITRIPAQRSVGVLAATGASSARIPAGTIWRRADGIEMRTLSEVAIASGNAVLPVEAVVAGASGNAIDGTQFTIVSPIAGVVSRATATGAIEGGADIETDASLRARLVARMRTPPRGGTASDYELWAFAARPDITRAWTRPRQRGLGTVNVFVMTDNATMNGIPASQTVQAVQSYIDGVRPVTADVSVLAPTAVPLNVDIEMLVPDTAGIQAAIRAEIGDLILRTSEPGGTILVSQLREAISIAEGETDHRLASPTNNVTVAAGEISVLGNVSFS